MVDFDLPLSRNGTLALKYEARLRLFGRADVQPLWVADMDFACPEPVVLALQQRAQHPVYGYTQADGQAQQAVATWWEQRHACRLKVENILLAPGMVPCLYAAVATLTQEGEGVLVQTPVYPPFFSAITDQNRRVVENPLQRTSAGYAIDWAHFEECVQRCRLFLLCSPHNPVGRVWTQEELLRLLTLCQRHGVYVFSDEIHADLLLAEHRHFSLAAFDSDRVITGVAPSKTFNIPGMGLSAVIMSEAELKRRWQAYWRCCPVSVSNPFALLAFTVAYTSGKEWLDQLLIYLTQTRDASCVFLQQELPWLKLHPPQATYLFWLDFSALCLPESLLERRLVQAGLGLSAGSSFGKNGCGFMRLNFAAPRAEIFQALQRLRQLAPSSTTAE